MKSIVRGGGLIAGAALILSGCGGADGARSAGAVTDPTVASPGVADVPVIVGEPYRIGDVTYTPADVMDYDDVGYAGWYGDDLSGQTTANGEIFDPARISAAHKTLPLPSYVEVTALDTGRTILVRVNDRGPMTNDQLIALSPAAAAQLGLAQGMTPVRVRRTNPPAAERAQLRSGKAVPERLATPASLLAILRTRAKALPAPKLASEPAPPVASATAKPGDDRMTVRGNVEPTAAKPATAATPTAAAGQYVVQVGAFSTEARANAAAKAVGGYVSKATNLWRVRIGPFADAAAAQGALAKARSSGFRDAVVQRDR
ncbi:septal ring lytic transglycosylase RlpA family protein [Sphingopyxis kveilinensis]|uniref:septal ring lytic transglycosylase RlpA family protein n=1 Tax=Sphingopyxis kveilinensis TaxID=3114367 RepID=UPI0030D26CBE